MSGSVDFVDLHTRLTFLKISFLQEKKAFENIIICSCALIRSGFPPLTQGWKDETYITTIHDFPGILTYVHGNIHTRIWHLFRLLFEHTFHFVEVFYIFSRISQKVYGVLTSVFPLNMAPGTKTNFWGFTSFRSMKINQFGIHI